MLERIYYYRNQVSTESLVFLYLLYKILLTVLNLLLWTFYVRIILLKDVFIIAKVNQKDYYIKVCFFCSIVKT